MLGHPLLGFMAIGYAQENFRTAMVGPGLPPQPWKGCHQRHRQGRLPLVLPANFSLGLRICQFGGFMNQLQD